MAILIPEVITANGWSLYEKCVCNGVHKYKFRNPAHPKLELEWWVRSFQFKIMNGNTTKVPLSRMGELKKVLESL